MPYVLGVAFMQCTDFLPELCFNMEKYDFSCASDRVKSVVVIIVTIISNTFAEVCWVPSQTSANALKLECGSEAWPGPVVFWSATTRPLIGWRWGRNLALRALNSTSSSSFPAPGVEAQQHSLCTSVRTHLNISMSLAFPYERELQSRELQIFQGKWE